MATKPTTKEDYFSILNCSPTSTYEELKQNYQQLIRKCHPDKNGGSEEIFINVDKAWKTLKDDNLREKYINSRKQEEYDANSDFIYAELRKEDLTFSGDDLSDEYPCRCGSKFIIYKTYLDEEEVIVECNECTNCIAIR